MRQMRQMRQKKGGNTYAGRQLWVTIVTLVTVLALLVGGTIVASYAVYTPHDAVTLRAVHEEGDLAATAGLTLQTWTEMDGRLFWENTFTFDGAGHSAMSSYAFHPLGVAAQRDQTPRDISLTIEYDATANLSQELEELTPIQQAVRQVWDEMRAGDTRELTLTVADYYEYYPFEVDILNRGLFQRGDTDHWQQITAAFSSYFKIPVLPGERMLLTMRKYQGGSNTSASTGIGHDGDCFFPEMISHVVTDEDGGVIYFTFFPYSSEGTLVDLSHLPRGYGLFSVRYHTLDNGGLRLDTESLGLAVALPLDIKIEYLGRAGQSGELLMLARETNGHGDETGRLQLYVLSPERGAVLQTLCADAAENKRYYSVYDGSEDYLVLRHYDGGLFYIVLARGADGTWSVALETGLPEVGREDGVAEEKLSELRGFDSGMENAMLWDGTRLAVVRNMTRAIDGYESARWSCDFQLTVWDANGLLYLGDYRTSLNTTGEEYSTAVDFSANKNWRLSLAE
ncbi:MAG: hypothetical protein IJW40_01735 [Clostridia bacterium]|nr:hypothetical protein [Clostridia bacterium]